MTALTLFIKAKGEALVPSIAAGYFGTSAGVVKQIYSHIKRGSSTQNSNTPSQPQ